MFDWTDDEEVEPFSEYGELDEAYKEPEDPDLGPEIPEAPDPSENDVDPMVAARFWALVVVFNVGIFAVAVGLMYAAFEGALKFGGQLIVAGLIVNAYGYYQYRKSKESVTERVDGETEESTDTVSDTDTTTTLGTRTVADEDGTHYVLLKESEDASLVRDPETGTQQHLPNDDLEVVEGESPLSTTATAVPEELRRVLTAVPDERALGLLLTIDASGPVGVRRLLSASDLCESDLHGLLAEFRAAGLVEEADVAGERGYTTTETASDALATLQR